MYCDECLSVCDYVYLWAAAAESSACGRGNAVGQTSILDRLQFSVTTSLQFGLCDVNEPWRALQCESWKRDDYNAQFTPPNAPQYLEMWDWHLHVVSRWGGVVKRRAGSAGL